MEGESEEKKIFEAKHGPPTPTALSLLMSFVFLLLQSALERELKNPFILPQRGLHHPSELPFVLICLSKGRKEGSWLGWTGARSGKMSAMMRSAWELGD